MSRLRLTAADVLAACIGATVGLLLVLALTEAWLRREVPR